MRRLLFALGCTLVLPTALEAQRDEGDWCREWDDRDRGWYCEIQETTIDARSQLRVDGGRNGGVKVVAWDGNGILIRARISARARSDRDAEELVNEVQILTDGTIRADGPRSGNRESWGVSFEILVPANTDLDMETHNGGVSVEGVSGTVRFQARNGGVSLHDLSGDVSGFTQNGGLSIVLTGREWSGKGMDVETRNGGVRMTIPADYSAHIETGTVNGRMDVDFPVTVQGRIGRRLAFDVGSGGKTVRARTTNGGVVLRQR